MSRKCVDCKYRLIDIDDEPCINCLQALNYEQGEPIEPERPTEPAKKGE